jgi:hypothetical protein
LVRIAAALALLVPLAALPAAPATYTVQRGDTLWDLSARFLDNPWYWPKIWAYNPHIANPHFIYPGNLVRFRTAAEGAPIQVEPAEEGPPPRRELAPLSRADMASPQTLGEGDEVSVGGRWRIGYVMPKGVHVRRDSFVTQREIDASGTLAAAFEEKLLLTTYDRAYVRFADLSQVKPGARYVLYRTDRAVVHPVTGQPFGFKSTVLGAARVVAVDSKVATVEITQAFEPIERGALVGAWTDGAVRQVRARPNRQELDGVIIASQQDLVSEIGEHHLVFVDRGRDDGVEEGNVFTVLRSGDPYGRDLDDVLHDPNLPDEEVGRLLVVDVQQRSCAAFVLKSLRELYVGDRVAMRPASAAAVPR